MLIRLNGDSFDVPNGCAIADLLQTLQLDNRYCAVEVNRMVVPREQHPSTRLKESDEVEIVTLVGGG